MSEIIKASTPLGLAICGTILGAIIIVSKVDAGPVAWGAISSIYGMAGGMGVASRTPKTKIDNVSVDESK